MTAMFACSITVLAMIGQAIEEVRTGAGIQSVGVQAITGALDVEAMPAGEYGWYESIQATVFSRFDDSSNESRTR